jgi:hypothetical protein
MLSSLRPQIVILTRHVLVDVEQCWTRRPATAVVLAVMSSSALALLLPTPPNLPLAAREGHATTTSTGQRSSRPCGPIQTGLGSNILILGAQHLPRPPPTIAVTNPHRLNCQSHWTHDDTRPFGVPYTPYFFITPLSPLPCCQSQCCGAVVLSSGILPRTRPELLYDADTLDTPLGTRGLALSVRCQ